MFCVESGRRANRPRRLSEALAGSFRPKSRRSRGPGFEETGIGPQANRSARSQGARPGPSFRSRPARSASRLKSGSSAGPGKSNRDRHGGLATGNRTSARHTKPLPTIAPPRDTSGHSPQAKSEKFAARRSYAKNGDTPTPPTPSVDQAITSD